MWACLSAVAAAIARIAGACEGVCVHVFVEVACKIKQGQGAVSQDAEERERECLPSDAILLLGVVLLFQPHVQVGLPFVQLLLGAAPQIPAHGVGGRDLRLIN